MNQGRARGGHGSIGDRRFERRADHLHDTDPHDGTLHVLQWWLHGDDKGQLGASSGGITLSLAVLQR